MRFLISSKLIIPFVFGALAKNGSFDFAKGRLVGGAKPNVPFVRWHFNFFCAVGKKLKHRRVGNECRLTRCPFVVSFLCLCSLVKMVYFFLFMSVVTLLLCRLLGGFKFLMQRFSEYKKMETLYLF